MPRTVEEIDVDVDLGRSVRLRDDARRQIVELEHQLIGMATVVELHTRRIDTGLAERADLTRQPVR